MGVAEAQAVGSIGQEEEIDRAGNESPSVAERFTSDHAAADAFGLLIGKHINELMNFAFITIRECQRKQQAEFLAMHFPGIFVDHFDHVAIEITPDVVSQHQRAAIGDAFVSGAFFDQRAFGLPCFDNAPGVIGAFHRGAVMDLKFFLSGSGCG